MTTTISKDLYDRVNVKNNEGNTPLHISIMLKQSQDMIAFLLSNWADPRIENKDGRSCIDIAREQGNNELVVILEGMSELFNYVVFE